METGLPNYWLNLFNGIDSNVNLNSDVSGDNVKIALFVIKGTKAPGPDRFPTIFYQRFWETCKEELIEMVRKAFNTSWFPNSLNHTLIAIIPKTDNPIRMNNLRPISLCNTVYKVIAKIIVTRLRPVLDDLISPV